MEVEFAAKELKRLYEEQQFNCGYEGQIVKIFRKRVQFIRSSADERDFYNMKSLHFEKLKGSRTGQYSMRLNNQHRLILELANSAKGKVVRIREITDYH